MSAKDKNKTSAPGGDRQQEIDRLEKEVDELRSLAKTAGADAEVTRNVAYSSRNVAAISQGHVLPGRPSAPGRPKIDITGR